MLREKSFYRNLKLPKNYEWGGGGDLPYTHFFVRGDYKTGFMRIDCSDDCIDNGDLIFLCENDMSCDKSRLKALSKNITKRINKQTNGAKND